MFNPLPTRQDILQSLEENEFDILVIGGGATGTGVALDSVTRGGFLSISSAMNSLCIDLEIEYAYMVLHEWFPSMWLGNSLASISSTKVGQFKLLSVAVILWWGFGMLLSNERSDF